MVCTLEALGQDVITSYSTLPQGYESYERQALALYWKNLYLDYREVAVETYSKSKNKPKKTMAIFTGVGILGYCASTTPDELKYRDQLLIYSNDMTLVGESIRNPRASRYLDQAEKYYDVGVVRSISLGIFSVMWLDNYDSKYGTGLPCLYRRSISISLELNATNTTRRMPTARPRFGSSVPRRARAVSSCGIYSSQCDYLKPRFTELTDRVLDVGFLGRWWILHNIMRDFDVNPIEFLNKT
uniref:Uncharacterized protein n=1 Tax=Timema genevievae TaxID=629358 RepID=A0A7R9K4X4_TIMGE|nr:unnamed protein product [Timema genevievae]